MNYLRKGLAALLILVVTLGGAQPAAACAPMLCTNDGALFGQTQAYDVLMRGNGEAVVNARIAFENSEADGVDKIDYSLVNGHLGDITAFEEVNCSILPVLSPTGTSVPVASVPPSTVSLPSASVKSTEIPGCYPLLSEHPIDVASPLTAAKPLPYYYPSGTAYQKIKITKSGDSFHLKLPQPINSAKSTTIVLAYTATGYAHASWGRSKFDFKTLKTDSKVSDVTVAVSVDEEYHLAGTAKGAVNYRVAGGAALDSKLTAGANSSAGAATADGFVGNIGQNGLLTKHASSLGANETFTVSGMFAKSEWVLDWPWTLGKILLGLALLAGFIWWWGRSKKLRPMRLVAAAKTDTAEVVSPNEAGATPQPFVNGPAYLSVFITKLRVRPLLFAGLCGALTLIIVALVTFGIEYSSSLDGSINSSGTASGTFLYLFSNILLAGAGIFGIAITSVALPIWYGRNAKEVVKVMTLIFIFLSGTTIILILLASWIGNQEHPTRNDSGCSMSIDSGNVCPLRGVY